MKPIYRTKEVDIILRDSSHAKNFGREKLIHEYEYDQAITFIQKMIPHKLDDNRALYLHNTITIFGTRGSGKTSFLLSLKKEFDAHQSLKPLRIIDPTLIEEKGHVFLNVIAAIREAVLFELNKMPQVESTRELKRAWRESTMRLAAGLPSIDGMAPSSHDSWQDPEYVLDKGLVSVGAALNLSETFDDFLKVSLGILHKTSFLLIFDDIDVDATKGWAVLETIRKYFTTSRLITVLSGDLKLYSLVIRQKKWGNFGKEILKYEGEQLGKLSYFNGMVSELESQYLQKIMQPRYRIHLLSLQEKRQINRLPRINVIMDEKSYLKKTELQAFYSTIFAKFGIRNPGQAEVFKSFMLSQPFRTQIQFALIMGERLLSAEETDNTEKITDIFLADLLEQEVDVNLATSMSKFLNSIILKLLIKRGQLKDLYQLQPSTTDNTLNSCLISLNLLLCKAFSESSFFLSFDYLIKIGYIRNLADSIGAYEPNYNQPGISNLCQSTGIFNDGVLRDTVGKINAYLMGTVYNGTRKVGDVPSYITILGLNGPAKRIMTDRLDFVFPADGSFRSALGYLPSFSGTYSFKNNTTVGYSIYMVIAALGELVRVFESQVEGSYSNSSELLSQIRTAIIELSQHRQYPAPDFRSAEGSLVYSDERDAVEEIGGLFESSQLSDEQLEEDEVFVSSLISWLNDVPRAIAPHVLGKISTRFYSALQNMHNRKPIGLPLGQYFHYQTVALMNSILIEDIRENVADSSFLNINNTSFSERILVNNLQQAIMNSGSSHQEKWLSYSKWMLRCPILLSYIIKPENEQLITLLFRYSMGKDTTSLFKGYNLSEQLDEISIEGNLSESPRGSKRDTSHAYLALRGNEKQLVSNLTKKAGNALALSDDDNKSVVAERNQILKAMLPGLFPDNKSYATKARKLRGRLKELKLI